MLCRTTSLLLLALVVAMPPTNAMTMQDTDPGTVWAAALQKAQDEGNDRVELRLADGRTVKGKIVAVHADRCEIQAGRDTVLVPYDRISSMRLKNNALSRPVKYLIIIGVGAAGYLLLALAAR